MSVSLEGKRVVFVVAWAILGGAERSAFAAMRQLRDCEGADVEVLALTDEHGRFREAVEQAGIPWHCYPLTWHGGKANKVRQLVGLGWHLRRLRPDVVAPYTSRPNVLCGLVWQATGASLCVWNQQDLGTPTKFGARLAWHAARNTPLLIANSYVAREHLVSSFRAPRERIHVIRKGVLAFEPLESGAVWRDRLEIGDETIVVSMLAHLHAGKDHITLLRGWPVVLRRLPESGRRAVLLLAGRPSGTEDALKALAFDLELGRTVRFLGDVSDVGGLLAATDIAVLSSPSESAPHALLEAMAAGLPFAGSDIPGIREIAVPAQRPYLAPPGDADRLAEAIAELGKDAETRTALGEENRRHVHARVPIPAPEATAAAIATALGERRGR